MPIRLPARAISIQTQPCRLPDAVPSKKPPRLQALYMAPIPISRPPRMDARLLPSRIGAKLPPPLMQRASMAPRIPSQNMPTMGLIKSGWASFGFPSNRPNKEAPRSAMS